MEASIPEKGLLSFSDIPSLVEGLLTNQEKPRRIEQSQVPELNRSWQKVVLILVDGLGTRFVEPLCDIENSAVNRVFQQGTTLTCRSQFPSTTTAHMVTIHCGVPVSSHGLYEWNIFDPSLDEIICPLLNSVVNETDSQGEYNDPYHRTELPFDKLIPWTTIYQRLREDGVSSFLYQPARFIDSPFSSWVGRGAERIGFEKLEDLATLVSTNLKKEGQSYSFVYIGSFDELTHYHGPDAEEPTAEGLRIFAQIELLIEQSRGPETLFLVTADHGQIAMNYRETIYLDDEPHGSRIKPLLRQTRSGRLAVPGGSHRDFFLWARPGAEKELLRELKEIIGDRGEVLAKSEVIDLNLFGKEPSKALLERLGDVLILPRKDQTVFWRGKDGVFEMKFFGHHGGLTDEECHIPLLVIGGK